METKNVIKSEIIKTEELSKEIKMMKKVNGKK